jgi:hypothetical protein
VAQMMYALARCWWLTSGILANQEDHSLKPDKYSQDPISKTPSHKKGELVNCSSDKNHCIANVRAWVQTPVHCPPPPQKK